MKNRGSTPILTNLVGVQLRNIHTKFEVNPCSGLRGEVINVFNEEKKSTMRYYIVTYSNTL